MICHVSGRIYAVGGSDGSHSLCSTEIYDPQKKTWTPGPNMTTARANVGIAVIGSRLYAVGGFSGTERSLGYYVGKLEGYLHFVIFFCSAVTIFSFVVNMHVKVKKKSKALPVRGL
jgi:hypothetical protein